jgi:hypothetical protein
MKSTVEEGIVYSLAVGQQDDAKKPLFGVDESPATNPAVRLHVLGHWMVDRELDPLVENASAIGSLPHGAKIDGRLQFNWDSVDCITLKLSCGRVKQMRSICNP